MLTRSATHAIRAMVALAALEPGQYARTADVAETTGVPRTYLGKILFQLARRGLVESQRGLGGGFRLAKGADRISLHKVVDAVEDLARWNDCAFGEKTCSGDNPCALHERWSVVRDSYFALLARTSIAELLVNRGSVEATLPIAATNSRRRTS